MYRRIKIVADSNIPFLEGIFEPYADIDYIDGKDIVHNDIVDADALIIRTRTRCNEALLAGTKVSLIATATIGTDHIDMEYCKTNGIRVYNAQGCNAGGVMQYVFTGLYGTASRNGIKLDGMTLGIIGVGNVGKKVEHMARYLGFNVLRGVHSMDEEHMSVAFEVETDRVPASHKHYGPPVSVTNSSFLDKWRGNPLGEPFIEDGRWVVIAPRQYSIASEMFAREVPMAGIGREIDISTMVIMDHDSTLDTLDPVMLTSLLSPKMPWENRWGL